MNIVTWNTRSLGRIQTELFLDFLKKKNPDVLLMQEPKVSIDRSPLYMHLESFGYNYSEFGKKKYVSCMYKSSEIKVHTHFQNHILDEAERLQVLENKDIYIVNAYLPFSKSKSSVKYKQKYLGELLPLLLKLKERKPVVFAGDFNMISEETGINARNQPGNFDFEREFLKDLSKNGFYDSYRESKDLRGSSFYTRLDYIWISQDLVSEKSRANFISYKDNMGSDHKPFQIILDR